MMTDYYRKLRERLRECPGKEHEQAIVRLIVGTSVLLYFIYFRWTGRVEDTAPEAIYLGFSFLGAALLLFGWVVVYPKKSLARRVVSIVADIGTLSWGMYLNGPLGVPL